MSSKVSEHYGVLAKLHALHSKSVGKLKPVTVEHVDRGTSVTRYLATVKAVSAWYTQWLSSPTQGVALNVAAELGKLFELARSLKSVKTACDMKSRDELADEAIAIAEECWNELTEAATRPAS